MWNTRSNIDETASVQQHEHQPPKAPEDRSAGALYPVSSEHPRGSVLLYTFVVLILMTLMGAALMVNSRTELQISGNTVKGREAFTNADSTARVALLLARAFLHPNSGRPRDYINDPNVVVLDNSLQTDNDLQQLAGAITVEQIRERYLRVTESDDSLVTPLIIKSGDLVVGTAFIALVKNIPELYGSGDGSSPGGFALTGGGTLSDGSYNTGGGGESNIQVNLVISSQGRLPREGNVGYFDEKQPGTYSIVTLIFREIMP